MSEISPMRPFSRTVRTGSTQLVTAVVIVLIAVIGVLLFVNPTPKSALNLQPVSPADDSPSSDTTPQNTPAETPQSNSVATPPPADNETNPETAVPMSAPPNVHDDAGSAQDQRPQMQQCPLVFEPSEFDYGYVLVGETKVEEIVVFNPTDRTIHVAELLTACPCTVAEIEPKAIAPDQAAVLTLKYTAQSFPHVPGKRSVRLRTIEYPNHSPGVIFSAAVGREIRVNADREPIIKERSGEIRLDSYDGEPFRVLMVDGRPPDFVGFDPESDEPRNSYLVNYDFSDRADDSFPRYLHILTDRESDPMTEILTYASPNFREPLVAQPAYWMAENRLVQVGTLGPDTSKVTRTITLLRMPPGSSDADLSVGIHPATGRSIIGGQTDRSEASPSAVEARVVSVEQDPTKARNRLVTVEFTLTPGIEPGLYHDIMSFILPDGSYTELDVATFVTDDN